MGTDAGGAVHPMSQTWEADYTQNQFGWVIEVHLEGDYQNR
jgi:hypothetical protein